jgi:cytochrome bd-type quinol oxidase subunit 2
MNLPMSGFLLIYIPIVLFVVAFLYETWLSFMRLGDHKKGKRGYVDVTWEVTHTLLVFAVVMILMLYTQVLDQLAALIFWPTFLAAIALGLRGVCYIYIFYVRKNSERTNWIDWVFAIMHVVAALLLVTVVLQVTWFILTSGAAVNTEFIPAFLPGLLLVAGVVALPIWTLYRSGKN